MNPNLEQQLDTKLHIPESAWVVDDHPDEQAMQMLREHLSEYNAAAANSREGCRLALFLHDEQARMIDGLNTAPARTRSRRRMHSQQQGGNVVINL